MRLPGHPHPRAWNAAAATTAEKASSILKGLADWRLDEAKGLWASKVIKNCNRLLL